MAAMWQGQIVTELQPSFSYIVTLIMILFYFCFSTSKIRLSDKIFVLFLVFQFLLYPQALDWESCILERIVSMI